MKIALTTAQFVVSHKYYSRKLKKKKKGLLYKGPQGTTFSFTSSYLEARMRLNILNNPFQAWRYLIHTPISNHYSSFDSNLYYF